MAVVDIALRIDGLEVTRANGLGVPRFDGDRFDPVKGVLKLKKLGSSEVEKELVREEGIAGSSSQIEEEGALRAQDSLHFACPVATPRQEGLARRGVVVAAVGDPQIVGRRSHDQIHALSREFPHAFETVAVMNVNLGRQAPSG